MDTSDTPPVDLSLDQTICQACKPAQGKTIATNEQGQCIVCNKPVLTSDNITNPQAIPETTPQSTPIVDNSADQPQNTEPLQGEVVENKPKHPGGRPSKYNEAMLQKAKDYYDLCRGKTDGKKRMPFIEELAMECDVDDKTINTWTNEPDNTEFRATIEKLKNLQKLRTVQQGYGAKNPTFAIFMLKANHGMVETEKRILAGERDSEPMNIQITDYQGASKQLPQAAAQVIEEGSE